ncbi:MAG: ketoacyl-ACP synthase III [Planctomycetaceae bacterium]|nr:ketoacyl-ACP synthase III [Planctomycetaceae bacterium]
MGTRVRGILTVVPRTLRTIDDLGRQFGPIEAERTAEVTGIRQMRAVAPGQTTTDLATEAGSRLLAHLGIAPETLDGIVFVTQTPDYFLPASACILHDRLKASKQCLAFDVNQGCSAYPYGLAVAAGLTAAGFCRRVLLLVGDVPVRIHPADQSTSSLFGAAVAATVLESDAENDLLGIDLGSDGAGWANLIVPVGNARYPSTAEFAARAPEALRRVAHPEHLNMEGAEIFTFTLREAPGIIERTLQRAGRTRDEVDYFFLHQASKFLLDHLIRKVKLPRERCPMSLGEYGNTWGASPAVTACHTATEANRDRELTAMFVGFGVGYSWGGALVRLRPGTLFAVEETDGH